MESGRRCTDWKCQVGLELKRGLARACEGSSGAAGGLVHCIGHTESITACDAGFKISKFDMFLTADSIKTESEAKVESPCFLQCVLKKSWMSDPVKSWTNDTHMSCSLFVQAPNSRRLPF